MPVGAGGDVPSPRISSGTGTAAPRHPCSTACDPRLPKVHSRPSARGNLLGTTNGRASASTGWLAPGADREETPSVTSPPDRNSRIAASPTASFRRGTRAPIDDGVARVTYSHPEIASAAHRNRPTTPRRLDSCRMTRTRRQRQGSPAQRPLIMGDAVGGSDRGKLGGTLRDRPVLRTFATAMRRSDDAVEVVTHPYQTGGEAPGPERVVEQCGANGDAPR